MVAFGLMQGSPLGSHFGAALFSLPSVLPLTVAGNVVQAAPGTDGSTNFMGGEQHCGDEPSHVDMQG